MKLQPESKKELLRIACGTAICTAAMWVLFAALHLVGWVRFDYTVVLGGLVGAAVAIANFAGICFVVQKIIDEQDEKRRKAKLQLSHNSRMLLQAVWVIVAIAAPCFQPFASVLPLFFPRITIYYLQITGKYKPLAQAAPAQDVSVEDEPVQAAAEFIVERLDQFVHENMGTHFDRYIPLVGAIFELSIGCTLISVVGLWSPTADLNTEAAWAIVVFVLIMYYKITTNGILSYLKGLLDPIFIMAPINVLSELSTPVSMAFRHFGNILSGTVISTLLYWALASLSHVIFGWLPGFLSQIQLFQIGIPAFTGLYFDWFGGCIQAFIFCTLTTIFIKRAAGED